MYNLKMKVGRDLKDDIRRAILIQRCLNGKGKLMTDANQYWESSDDAIKWMKSMHLALFKEGLNGIEWIEEPSAPDDLIGHQVIANASLMSMKFAINIANFSDNFFFVRNCVIF